MVLKSTFFRAMAFLLLLTGVSACDMEQEIEVKLPKLPPQMVVECYLENGLPAKLALSESSGYFDATQPTIIDDATVTITKNNEAPMKLTFQLEVNEETQKIFTHRSRDIIQAKPGDVFKLEITDPRGRRVTGTTTVLPVTKIDSVGWKFNDKPVEVQQAYLSIRFQDDPAAKNFYRLLVQKTDSSGTSSSLQRELHDGLGNGNKVTYITPYRFSLEDTLYVKLYNIEEAYYKFITSAEDARRANGNPFAQPAVVTSTVADGFGVFTFLNYDVKEVILK